MPYQENPSPWADNPGTLVHYLEYTSYSDKTWGFYDEDNIDVDGTERTANGRVKFAYRDTNFQMFDENGKSKLPPLSAEPSNNYYMDYLYANNNANDEMQSGTLKRTLNQGVNPSNIPLVFPYPVHPTGEGLPYHEYGGLLYTLHPDIEAAGLFNTTVSPPSETSPALIETNANGWQGQPTYRIKSNENWLNMNTSPPPNAYWKHVYGGIRICQGKVTRGLGSWQNPASSHKNKGPRPPQSQNQILEVRNFRVSMK